MGTVTKRRHVCFQPRRCLFAHSVEGKCEICLRHRQNTSPSNDIHLASWLSPRPLNSFLASPRRERRHVIGEHMALQADPTQLRLQVQQPPPTSRDSRAGRPRSARRWAGSRPGTNAARAAPPGRDGHGDPRRRPPSPHGRRACDCASPPAPRAAARRASSRARHAREPARQCVRPSHDRPAPPEAAPPPPPRSPHRYGALAPRRAAIPLGRRGRDSELRYAEKHWLRFSELRCTSHMWRNLLIFLVGDDGFEPPTSSV